MTSPRGKMRRVVVPRSIGEDMGKAAIITEELI